MSFRNDSRRAVSGQSANTVNQGAIAEALFHRMIALERRRAARSGKSFLLMLLDVSATPRTGNKNIELADRVVSGLSRITRETDVTGWYRQKSVVGVMFTEVVSDDLKTITATIMDRVARTLKQGLAPDQFDNISFSFLSLPEVREQEPSPHTVHPTVYPGISISTV